jgi:6-phosphogluconate dehydrogenase
LYAAKICSYAQGMNLIQAKSLEKDGTWIWVSLPGFVVVVVVE